MQRRLLLLLGLYGLVASTVKADNILDNELFNRVSEHMRINLARLPNYTCVETVERSRRSSQNTKFELVDRIRLEIAMVNGKEMFSWPGAGNFEDKDIDDLMLGGAFGNGNFGLLARAIFLTSAPNFTFIGERIYEGRRTNRWDFNVPRQRGIYGIGNRRRRAVAGLRGTFWADAETNDVVRIEIRAEDIPPELEIVAAENSIDYMRVNIGGAEFLLPKAAELRMRDYAGEWRNVIGLSACRQYLGESKISFADTEPETEAKAPEDDVITMPAKKDIEARLKTDVRFDTAAIGDPITAELVRDVKSNGGVLIPKKAELHGRIVSLRLQRGSMKYHVVGIGFDEFVAGKTRGRMRAKLVDVRVAGNTVSMNPLELRRLGGGHLGAGWMQSEQIVAPGVLFVAPSRLLLPAGMQMVWRTESLLFGDSE